MTTEREGQVRLTWQQFIWGIAIFATILMTWADIRNRVISLEASIGGVYTKFEIDRMKLSADGEHEELRRDINKIKRKLGMED